MLHRIPSIDKIAAAIGWRPTLSLDEILGELIARARREEPAPVPTTNA
jgi:nucleoside-diphosphate-sugar epimerase